MMVQFLLLLLFFQVYEPNLGLNWMKLLGSRPVWLQAISCVIECLGSPLFSFKMSNAPMSSRCMRLRSCQPGS